MVTFPQIQWLQHDPAIDPSGHRHEHNPSFGFLKVLNTNPGGELDFGAVNVALSGKVSDTKLVMFRPVSLGDASGVFNFKMFLVSISSWGAGTYRFLERKTIHFNQNLVLTQADADTPTVVPATPNVKGTLAPFFLNGQPHLSGILDQDVSQYIYLAVFADTNVPPQQYGGAGSNGFRFRLLYDF